MEHAEGGASLRGDANGAGSSSSITFRGDVI
jgi:hypothetical protein